MQIQYGSYRGKKLVSPEGARLVSGRVKKAVFEVLKDHIGQAKVLDLYAGSGSLGLECLSLGASEAVFVDTSRDSLAAIEKNIRSLGVSSRSEMLRCPAQEAVKDLYRQGRFFDLVLLDPPYYQDLVRKSLQCLSEYDIVAPSRLVACFFFYKEQSLEAEFPLYTEVFNRRYGDTTVAILQKVDTDR